MSADPDPRQHQNHVPKRIGQSLNGLIAIVVLTSSCSQKSEVENVMGPRMSERKDVVPLVDRLRAIGDSRNAPRVEAYRQVTPQAIGGVRDPEEFQTYVDRDTYQNEQPQPVQAQPAQPQPLNYMEPGMSGRICRTAIAMMFRQNPRSVRISEDNDYDAVVYYRTLVRYEIQTWAYHCHFEGGNIRWRAVHGGQIGRWMNQLNDPIVTWQKNGYGLTVDVSGIRQTVQ